MPDTEHALPFRDRVLFTLAIYASAMTIYFAAGHAARPAVVSLATPIDDALPFVPAAMFLYALAYVVPLALLWLETTESGMRRLGRAVVLAYAMASPFFLAMPVVDADPEVAAQTGAEHMLVVNRGLDVTKNAFPSMHVGLVVLLALVGQRRSRAWGLSLGLAAVLISGSTLFVKQHFLVDIPAGALVGYLSFRIVYGKSPTGGGVS